MAGKTCADCRHCKMQDYGYSNYTVEGTSVECIINAHPNGEFDRWYGEDWRLQWANWCEKFRPGGCVHICVEGEVR